MKKKREKIEEKIKKLNETRAMYHHRLNEAEKKWKNGEISSDVFDKHKKKYEKYRNKIRRKIHLLEEKLENI